MEAPRSALQRAQRARRRRRVIAALAVAFVLLAVILPCALLLPGTRRSGLASTVLLPLYIYPSPNAWDPLYRALDERGRPNFAVIVNPDSGPGLAQGPGEDYVAAITRLMSASDVQLFGYVRTGYATRNVSAVLEDIAIYSNWTQGADGIAVSGIFFDEAPHEYSAEAEDFMRLINRAVKDAPGILGSKTVIHNPGVIPDSQLEVPGTDIAVVFEQSYEEYGRQQSALSSLPMDRRRYSCLLHSLPSSENPRKLLGRLSRQAEYLFVTTLDQNYYESFGPDWMRFVRSMPT